MFAQNKSDALLGMIRAGQSMTGREQAHLILLLSIPSILAQLTNILMFYIDASMVGSLGAEPSAAIGIVETTIWLTGSITSAAAMGFSVLVAHRIGASRFDDARSIFRQGIMFTTIFSLLIGALCVGVSWHLPVWLGGAPEICHDATVYFIIFGLSVPFMQMRSLAASMLKCAGNMRVPSLMSILMCVLDVAANFLLIFPTRQVSIDWFPSEPFLITIPGAGWGVAGAAAGTSFSFIIVSLVMMWFAMYRSSDLSLDRDSGSWRINWQEVGRAVRISLPMAAQGIMMSGAQIVSTIIVAPLGTIAIAANSFAITAESLCYMPGYGIGEAATTLVGQSLGARQWRLTHSFARLCVLAGMLVMAFMGVVMYVFAPEMMASLSPVRAIQEVGVESLRIEAWAEPFFAASIVCYSICVGAGDTFKPACMNLISMWCVRLTLAALLAPAYGLPGVWFAMAVELTFRGTIFLVRIFWRGGKLWIKRK